MKECFEQFPYTGGCQHYSRDKQDCQGCPDHFETIRRDRKRFERMVCLENRTRLKTGAPPLPILR